MNKKIFLTVPAMAIVFLSSCLTSLHNLVTYKNITTDDRITGNWQYDGMTVTMESTPASIFFKNMSSTTVNGEEKKSSYGSKEDSLLYSKSYIVNFIKNNYHYYMVCYLTRIGNDLYADIQPLTAELVNKVPAEDVTDLFSGGNYIASHSIAKVIFHDSEIEFRVLNSDFISDQLKNGAAAIRYEKDNLFNTTLITASPGELWQFLIKYGNDARLYNRENTITLKKT
jgi:hypothetical protein